MFIYLLVDRFQKAKIPFAVIGGMAMALHGLVRATIDIDLVLSLKGSDFEKAEKVLQDMGLQSRIPVTGKDISNFREEYLVKRNLRAWSFINPKDPLQQVDILIDRGLSEIEVVPVKVGGRKVPIASLESLLKMKLESGRPQDLVDVESLREKLKT